MKIKKFESFMPNPSTNKEESLEDLVNKDYKSQDINLTSLEITSILRLLKNNIDRLKSKNMLRMAENKEYLLRGILKKLN